MKRSPGIKVENYQFGELFSSALLALALMYFFFGFCFSAGAASCPNVFNTSLSEQFGRNRFCATDTARYDASYVGGFGIPTFTFFWDTNLNDILDPGEAVTTDLQNGSTLDGVLWTNDIRNGQRMKVLIQAVGCAGSFVQTSISDAIVFNCGIDKELSCLCLDNATNGVNGQFLDEIRVNAAVGQNWTVVSSINAFDISSPNPPAAPIALAAGSILLTSIATPDIYRISLKHVDSQPYTVVVSNGQTQLTITGGCVYPHPIINIADSYCRNFPPFLVSLTDPIAPGASTTITANGVNITTFNASSYAAGSTVTIAWAYDGSATGGINPGCNVTGSKTVAIEPGVTGAACHDINLSISELGYSVLIPEMFLDGVPCQPSFDVMVMGHDDTMTCADLGKTFRVMIMGYGLGCSATVTIEDKLAPVFDCRDLTVACGTDIWAHDIEEFVSVTDNCTDDVTITLIDERIYDTRCHPDYSGYLHRSYRAVDQFGNFSTCSHNIYFAKGNLISVVFPPDITLDCFNPDLSISATGVPTLDGSPVRGFCELTPTYTDINITQCCGGVLKRMWTVRDQCTMIARTQLQTITLIDTRPPTLSCGPNLTLNAAIDLCGVNYTIPAPNVSDNCSRPTDILITRLHNGTLVFGNSIFLGVGDNTISYFASDCCGNLSYCSYTVRVIDRVAPNMVCNGSEATVCLDPLTGIVVFPYQNIGGNFFTDNCQILDTAIALMGGVFGTQVTFTCAQSGHQMISIRVRDVSGNANFCMVRILVLDKSVPIVRCAPDITVNCDVAAGNIAAAFPAPQVTTLCPASNSTALNVLGSLNACNVGNITFVFTTTNISSNMSASCQTRATILNLDPLTSADIIWPANFSTTACTVDTTRNTRGVPTILGTHCFPPAVNSTDIFSNLDSQSGCFRFIRRWTVTDQCSGISFGHDQSITGLNAGTPRIIAGADITLNSIANACNASAVLPALLVYNCGNSMTITNSFNNNGASVTATFPVGRTKVVYTAINSCGAIAVDDMTITVIDNTPPVVMNCPADLTVDCTTNVFPLAQYGAPTITDNCVNPLIVRYREVFDTTQCSQGIITRIWAASDNGVDSVYCRQTITKSGVRFGLANITWSPDITFTCAQNISFGTPTFTNIGCSRLSVNFADVTISTAASGCLQIKRTWTVRDSCQLMIGTTIGIFTDIQDISKSPVGIPTLAVPGNIITIVNPTMGGNCTALVNLNPATSTNCGGTVTITHNSIYAFNTTGANASGNYPVGTHSVRFTATNACGSNSSVVQIIVRDLTSPQIMCPLDVTIDCTADLSVTINNLISLVTYTDNCTLQDLSVSIANNTSCNGGDIVITFTIRDQSNNQASCQSTIHVLPPSTPFDPASINWPSTPLNVNCQPNYSPTTLGSLPTIPASACRNISVTFSDVTVSPSNPSICKEFIRTWRVGVPCSGDYTFSQTIQIRDNDVPIFSGLPPEIIVTPPFGACNVSVNLSGLMVSDCHMVSISHNSTWATLGTNNIDASGLYPINAFKIIYIATDMCGNVSQFILKLSISNNGCPLLRTIAGVVRSENNQLMEGVDVKINDNVPLKTDFRGFYYDRNIQSNQNYIIKAHKNINPRNGVSTLDVLQIQKYILGTGQLNSPYKMIAADINKSGSITTSDIVELRKLILGKIDNFANNESWRFVPSNMDLPTYPNFLSMLEINQYSIENLNLDHSRLDFTGVKVGDVNNTATTFLQGIEERNGGSPIELLFEDEILHKGKSYSIPIYINNKAQWIGMQGEIKFKSKGFNVNKVTYTENSPFNSNQIYVVDSEDQGVRFSLSTPTPIQGDPNTPVMFIIGTAQKDCRLSEIIDLSDEIVQGQFYAENEGVFPIDLNVKKSNSGFNTDVSELTLIGNSPNPFYDYTDIRFLLPDGQVVSIDIYDVQGKVIKNIEWKGNKGLNIVKVRDLNLSSSMPLYYQVKVDEKVVSGKMIFIKK